MIVIVILAVVVGICIGFFVWKSKKNKAAKNCTCGHAYTIDDLVSYRKEEKITMMNGQQSSSVYVTLTCPKCGETQEKRIIVSYNVNFGQTLKDGICNFF